MAGDHNYAVSTTTPLRHEKFARRPRGLAAPADFANAMIPAGHPEEEAVSGSEDYLATLARIHQALGPALYLEIGVREGRSLELARGAAIGIDPAMKLAQAISGATLFHGTSDAFFESRAAVAIDRPIEMAFIDGLHLFEYALRDFRNVELRASPGGLVVVDDIFPNHPVQGSRFRRTRAWTGDVWRLVRCLTEERPDLVLLRLDCKPTGLLLIAGLDPSSDVLWKRYDTIVDRHLSVCLDVPPAEVLARSGAIEPGSAIVEDLLATLRKHRDQGAGPGTVRKSLDRFQRRHRIGSGARFWSRFMEEMRHGRA